MSDNNWLLWAKEIQAIAQTGLEYSDDIYDIERFTRLREIACSMLEEPTGLDKGEIYDLFCLDEGYQTPKVDTRAVVVVDNKILLVQENDGRWSLPGGWMDVTETISSNTEKEAYEEAGRRVKAEKILAVLDRNTHNPGFSAYTIIKIFVACSDLGGEFKANSETIAADFFSLEEAKEIELSIEKTTYEQLELSIEAYNSKNWQVPFD